MKIVLVGCGASKRPGGPLDRWPARDLYTSALFDKARRWAETHGDRWFVLSALHGLVEPGAMIAPYDFTFAGRKEYREAWPLRVVAQLAPHLSDGDEVAILAGAEYATGIADGLRDLEIRVRVSQPLRGLQIGERLAWFNRVQGVQEVLL